MLYSRNVSTANTNGMTVIPNSFYPLSMSSNDKVFEFWMKIGWNPKLNDQSLLAARSPSISILDINSHPSQAHFQHYTGVSLGQITHADVTPEIIQTDEKLRTINAMERECYFDDERKLRFFKVILFCHLRVFHK